VFPAKRPGRCCAWQRKPFLEHLLRGGFLVPSPRALRGSVLQQLESDLFSFSSPRPPKFEFLSEALPGPVSLRALSPKSNLRSGSEAMDRGEGNFVGQNHLRAFDRKWPVPVPQSHAKNLPHDSVKGAERLRHPHDRVVGTLSYRRPQRQFRERVLCQMPTACHSRSLGQQDKWFLSPAWVANRLS